MYAELLTAATQLGGAALSNQPQAAPGIAGPATSGAGPLSAKIGNDFSGWTVATSGSRADGAQISKENGVALPQGGAGWLLVGAAVLGVVLLWRRK